MLTLILLTLLGADNNLLDKPAAKCDNCLVDTQPQPYKLGPRETAYMKSLETGKPLVIWVGGNFCDRCVQDSKDEFVHMFVNDWQGHRGPATVVCAPHQGEMYRVGTVTKWTVGSHDWGHVPSARRIIAEWRRRAVVGDLSPLSMLDLGDGGKWGWPADRQSLPSNGNAPERPASRVGVISRSPFRMSGGSVPVPARSFSSRGSSGNC